MKATSKLLIFIIAFLALIASVNAQTQSEQLKQMVAQLQTTPGDSALRERIIKFAATMKPAPAIPEDAERYEGRAKFAFKNAKSTDDYSDAAKEYEKAVQAAPWIPGYYTDLCTIYEKAGKYPDAKRHCETYLKTLTDPSQISETKQLLAGLDYGIEKAATATVEAEKAAQAARLQAVAEKTKRFSGTWANYLYEVSIDASGSSCSISSSYSIWAGSRKVVEWCKVTNEMLQLRVSGYGGGGENTIWSICELSLGADGNQLIGKSISGWTSANTSIGMKGQLCQGLQRKM